MRKCPGEKQPTGAGPSLGVHKHVFSHVLVTSRDSGKSTSRGTTGEGRTSSRIRLEGCGTEDYRREGGVETEKWTLLKALICQMVQNVLLNSQFHSAKTGLEYLKIYGLPVKRPSLELRYGLPPIDCKPHLFSVMWRGLT